MSKMLIPILFAVGTAIFWGCYGPTIGNAQAPKPEGVPLWSPFKPYVFIGIAYLVIAVIGGLIMMKVKGDTFSFTGQYAPTMKWGFMAGCLGAFGALCLTTAMMTSRGNALLVMPIVFGGAVSVTAIVSVIKLGGGTQINPLLWVGMALTITGVVIVAKNTPHGHGPKPAGAADADHAKVESAPSVTAESTPVDSTPETESVT
ncbi:MAG: hypothetical protein AAGG48_19675 [Planctomycetota bacterium]